MNPKLPRPVSETDVSVTFSKGDWLAFLGCLDAECDRVTVVEAIAERALLGKPRYKCLLYTAVEIERMLDGASPLTILRERVGLTQRELAVKAEMIPTYVMALETGREPGNAAVWHRLAQALNVPVEMLVVE